MTKNCGFATSIIGASHIRKQIPCQDNSCYIKGKGYETVVVSDGHGGAKHFRSQFGSEFAVQVVKETIGSFVAALGDNANVTDEKINEYEKSIIFLWRSKVEKDFEKKPFTDLELKDLSPNENKEVNEDFHLAYGATFLCGLKVKGKIIFMQLGDGNCVIMDNHKTYEPLEDDDRLKYGFTTSLCSQTAISDFRHIILHDCEKCSLFLTSDGIINSFENVDAFYKFLRIVCDNIKSKEFLSDLNVFLQELSTRGSSDDMSLTAIYSEG